MKKTGFTLVELIAVIVILGIIVGVSVPIYMSVRDNILETQYENTVTRIETAAASYAQDANSQDVVDVNVAFLIENGYISADDETDIYNPVDNTSLNCNMIHVVIENGNYVATFIENNDDNNYINDDGTCSLYVKVGDYTIKCNQSTCLSDWYNEDVELTLYKGTEKIDDATIEWTSQLGVYEVASSITTSTLYLTSTTYIATYIDSEGIINKSSQVIKVDKEKSVINEITYENVLDSWVESNTMYVSATDRNGSGISGYALISSDGDCSDANYQTDSSFTLTNNDYIVCVKDYAGNITTSDEITIDNIDDADPSISYDYDPKTWTTEVTLTFSASDTSSGIRGYAITTENSQPTVYINANRTSEYTTWDGSETSLSETENATYYLWVVDNVGNVSSKSVEITKIDRVTPEVSISATKSSSKTAVSSNTWSNEGLNFTFSEDTCGISGCTIYYCVDTRNTCNPSTVATSGTTINLYNSKDDVYYIRYYMVSNAGLSSNIASYTAKVDVTVPTTPTVTLKKVNSSGSTLADATWTNGNVYTVASGSTDSQSGFDHYEYYTTTTQSIPTSSGTSGSAKTVSTENTSYIYYRACDKVGNCSAWVLKTLKIDTTKPTCNYSGESTSWTKTGKTITVTCSDSGSGCNSSYSSKSFNYSSTTKTASISYTIKDNVGNETTCSKTANVYVDTTAPSCSTSKSNTGTTSGVTVRVSCSDTGSGVSTCAGVSGTSTSKTGVKSSTSYTVTDAVGNSNTCSVTVSTGTINGSCLSYSPYDCNCYTTDYYTTASEQYCAAYASGYSCGTCYSTTYTCDYNGASYDSYNGCYSSCAGTSGIDCSSSSSSYSCNCSSYSYCSSYATRYYQVYSYSTTTCDTCYECSSYEQLKAYY